MRWRGHFFRHLMAQDQIVAAARDQNSPRSHHFPANPDPVGHLAEVSLPHVVLLRQVLVQPLLDDAQRPLGLLSRLLLLAEACWWSSTTTRHESTAPRATGPPPRRLAPYDPHGYKWAPPFRPRVDGRETAAGAEELLRARRQDVAGGRTSLKRSEAGPFRSSAMEMLVADLAEHHHRRSRGDRRVGRRGRPPHERERIAGQGQRVLTPSSTGSDPSRHAEFSSRIPCMTWMEWYDNLAKPSWTPHAFDHQPDLMILYPIILVSFGFRVRSGISGQGRLEDRPAVRHQPRLQSALHADLFRVAKRHWPAWTS